MAKGFFSPWRLLAALVLLALPLRTEALLDEADQAGLVSFYKGLYNAHLTTWNIALDLCNQKGVTCDLSNPNRVTSLVLNGLGLQGTVSNALGSLTSLQTLDLSFNSLSGTLPSSLALPNLNFLRLNTNFFWGNIPSEFAIIPLNELRLDSNYLTGVLPNLSLAPLEVLTLLGNNLCPPIDYSAWASVSSDYDGIGTCFSCSICANGGTCTNLGSHSECTCPSLYYGLGCEKVFEEGNVSAMLTVTQYLGGDDVAQVELVTKVNYPYQLTAPSLLASPSLGEAIMAVSVGDFLGGCTGLDSSDCLQLALFNISNIRGASLCDYGGNYTLGFELKCRAGVFGCSSGEPLDTSTLTFWLHEVDLCGASLLQSSVSASLIPYRDETYSFVQLAFVAGKRVYLKATIDGLDAQLTLFGLTLNISGVEVQLMDQFALVEPFDSSLGLSFHDLGEPRTLAFSFVATYGEQPGDIFSPSSLTGVAVVQVRAVFHIQYTFGPSRRRDLPGAASASASASSFLPHQPSEAVMTRAIVIGRPR